MYSCSRAFLVLLTKNTKKCLDDPIKHSIYAPQSRICDTFSCPTF